MSIDNIKALCSRQGWKTGRDGCFGKGNIPANKGRKMPFNPNSARTQFKPGSVPANVKPLGHERIGKSGYIEMKVAERNPYTGAPTRYRQKHINLWEARNGPLPKGHALKCLDGNRTNTSPENWIAVPRALLPRLAGRWTLPFDTAPSELKPAVLAAAQLKHLTRTKLKGKNHGQRN